LMHGLVAWRVRRAWQQRPDKGLFYFAVFITMIIWSLNRDLIYHWRDTFYHMVFAFVAYQCAKPVLQLLYTGMPMERYEQPQIRTQL